MKKLHQDKVQEKKKNADDQPQCLKATSQVNSQETNISCKLCVSNVDNSLLLRQSKDRH